MANLTLCASGVDVKQICKELVEQGFVLINKYGLSEKDNRYFSYDKHIHPLECCLLDEKIDGFINHQIAIKLNKDPNWVSGFFDGYKQYAPNYNLCNKKRYQEGYKEGKDFDVLYKY